MPNATSQSIKDEVIRLHILGYTNKQIAQNAGTSTGNVSNIINEFKNHIDEGDYQNTKVLANLCKINDIKPSDVLDGIATNRLLKNNDLGRNGFEKHVQAYSKLPDTIESSELVNYSLRLYEIDSRTDTNIEDIPKYYESILDKSQKLESKIESQQKQSQELTLQTSKELKKRDITLERLEQFDSDKKFLLKLGLDVDDALRGYPKITKRKYQILAEKARPIQERMSRRKGYN